MLGACLQGVALYGQETKAPMYLEQKGEGEAEQQGPIYTGLVIAYGVRIPPPYHLTLRNDTCWINDVPWGPRKRPPETPFSTFLDSARMHREYILVLNIEHTYCNCLKYGTEAARDSVIQQYGSDTLLSSLHVGPLGSGITLRWNDNRQEMIFLDYLCSSLSHSSEQDSLKRAFYLKRIAGLREDLQRNATIIYSYYTGPDTRLWKEDAVEFQNIMHDARKGVITLHEAEIRLRKMVPKIYIPDIIAHWESWD